LNGNHSKPTAIHAFSMPDEQAARLKANKCAVEGRYS
jgi:hypothetical protein